jgi:DNA-binding winged helix-turn-helix (wHTH) protein
MLWSWKPRTGALTIDRVDRTVALGRRSIDLSPLLFRLLQHLADRPGQTVTRSEIKHVLWPYAARIDTDRRLNTAIRAVRAALDDDAEAPRFVETVRSLGYRWIGKERARTSTKAVVGAASGIALIMLSVTILPGSEPERPDLATTLTAQRAMEQWRKQPTAATASRASSALSQTGSDTEPSLLVLKAEFELGSAWHWSAAERDYDRALEQEPHNADARLGLAWLRANQGRRSEALVLVRGLLGSEVLSGDRRASLGWLLIRIGRPDLAVLSCGDDASASINDLSCSHAALAGLGHFAEAKTVALLIVKRTPGQSAAAAGLQRQSPFEAYSSFLSWRARHFLPAGAAWFQKAQVLADAGDTSAALNALERSISTREPLAVKIASTPSFVTLRGNPRFRQLVRAVGA